jgi:hypothetical protein
MSMALTGVNEKYLAQLEEKIFNEFDQDRNNRFSKAEFPAVIRMVTQLVGAEVPMEDDVEDLFNLLDFNGDQAIDRAELMSLIRTFFKILEEKDIRIDVEKESDIVI